MTLRIEAAPPALKPASWVEARLGISRPTRIKLEDDGVLHPIRLTPNGQRRYDPAEVEALVGEPVPALAEGGDAQ